MKTKLIGIIICMLLVGTVLPVSGTLIIDNTGSSNMSGNTLYVGGSGGGNYTRIQDAINDSIDGDTVYVYDDSSPYYENLIVDKSINLMGEDRDTTVIDGNGSGDVVKISVDLVKVRGFTIQNSGSGKTNAGIDIHSNYSIITNNNILNNYLCGIFLTNSNSNNIMGNIISYNGYGIYLNYSSFNNITGNNISYILECGIFFKDSNYNTITGNTITSISFGFGIVLGDSSHNTIIDNNILDNFYGMHLTSFSYNNVIYHNNFINNEWVNANDDGDNTWDDGKYGNYWSDYEVKYPNAKKSILKPWMWNTPYEILGGSNKDNCPLIEQWPKTLSRDKYENKPLDEYTEIVSIVIGEGTGRKIENTRINVTNGDVFIYAFTTSGFYNKRVSKVEINFFMGLCLTKYTWITFIGVAIGNIDWE